MIASQPQQELHPKDAEFRATAAVERWSADPPKRAAWRRMELIKGETWPIVLSDKICLSDLDSRTLSGFMLSCALLHWSHGAPWRH